MTKGDKHGSKRRKVNSPRTIRSVRPNFDSGFAHYDLCAGMLGHEGARFNEGVYGGVFRTIRIHPVHLQGKDKR